MARESMRRQTSIVLAVVLFAALSVVVSLLFILKDRLQASARRTPTRIASGLHPDMLKPDIPNFELIEDFAQRAQEDFPNLKQLFVTKLRSDNLECCIYPWYRPELARTQLQRIQIEQDGAVLGYLYYSLNLRREQYFAALINILIPLLILAAFALAFHVRRQERMLTSTQVQLIEKNQELAHLERLSLAGQLAANLLHDLKKPMLHIRDELRHSKEALDHQTLQEQAELFFQMLRETNLEKLASTSDDREEYLDIEAILRDSINLVKYEQNQVEVHLEVEPQLPLIHTYKYRLIQVFSNLLLNAFQALQGRGEIRIQASFIPVDPPAHSQVRSSPARRFPSCGIEVEIRDNGPGIPSEHLARVFEPFYSASGHPEASGLGLYISRSIIETLGGKIDIHSIVGQGTTVQVFLPTEENE